MYRSSYAKNDFRGVGFGHEREDTKMENEEYTLTQKVAVFELLEHRQ